MKSTLPQRGGPSESITLAAPPFPFASGDRLADRYTIIELYGAGPLGFTFRATDRDEQPVAVKILHPSLVPTESERHAALDALDKLAGQHLRGTALPTDAGITGKYAYVVSPWIQGGSLRRVLGAYRDAALSLSQAEIHGILGGVVDALRELHAFFVHGALYPESVQITQTSRVMLTDAVLVTGIARARWLSHMEYFPDVFPYVSPEVIKGKALTASADLWSVGALASEILTGDPASVREGIAPAMLHAWPEDVGASLERTLANKPGARAAAVPALIRALSTVAPSRALPRSGNLPPQRARTELILPAAVAPNEGTSPGISLFQRVPRKKPRPKR
jgi:serine/threonine protein kinase